MKTFVRSLVLLALMACAPAYALTRSQIPTKIGVPWGNSAGGSYLRTIPVPSQIGIQNCAASFTDGFPPLTFTPAGAGGCPPFGQDFNGILNAVTLWNRWASAGGPMPYDSAFQTAIGGYPQGAMVQSAILLGRIWYSTADNNTTNPDDQTGAAVTWAAMPGTYAAGTPVPSFSATPPLNTVSANGNSVGNASSNATNRANADAYWLFVHLWANCATCTVFNSSGSVVARGGSAAADWAANRAIATIDMRGADFMGADAGGSAFLAGVPVTTGSTTTGGSIIGENLHTLSAGELAAHVHPNTLSDPGHTHTIVNTVTGLSGIALTVSGSNAFAAGSQARRDIASPDIINNVSTTGITINNGSAGSNLPHNNVARSALGFWALSL